MDSDQSGAWGYFRSCDIVYLLMRYVFHKSYLTKSVWFAFYKMGRKFRLHHKKRKYGTTSLVISIPRSAVSVMKVTIPLDALPTPEDGDNDVTSLPISLSRSLYTAGVVKSLDSLQCRILQAGLLPSGMTRNIRSVSLFFTSHV